MNDISGTPRNTPSGYNRIEDVPLLRGHNHCQHCLCSPCVVVQPPNFLRGSCDPHPANSEKRHMLYRKFWRCLSSLGVWRDDGYLRRKEARTVREDRRDIIPDCIVEVGPWSESNDLNNFPFFFLLQEIRNRYPSHDGCYRDYLSTYDASTDLNIEENMDDSIDNTD